MLCRSETSTGMFLVMQFILVIFVCCLIMVVYNFVKKKINHSKQNSVLLSPFETADIHEHVMI